MKKIYVFPWELQDFLLLLAKILIIIKKRKLNDYKGERYFYFFVKDKLMSETKIIKVFFGDKEFF